MSSVVSRTRGVVAAACLLSACSVTRQRVDLEVRGDVPPARAAQSTFDRQLTAAFRCPNDGRGDYGPQACFELGERHDREIVGGPLGVAASVLPGVECADLCTQRRISITPITTKLGRPPDPAEIARRVAPSGPTNPQVRDVARRAYEEAVRSRYRSYAAYVSGEISDADYVEIGAVRYGSGHIYEGVRDALTEIADSYAALEWGRFEREWGSAPRTRPARGSPGRQQSSPPAASSTEEANAGGAPAPPEPTTAPAAPPASPRPADKPSAPPAKAPIARADEVPCRRSCGLRYRACLARCRNEPITGGGYDACAYECSGSSLACRGACDAPAAP